MSLGRVTSRVVFGTVIVLAGFVLYVRYIEPHMDALAAPHPAVDYNERLGSGQDVLAAIRAHLPPEAVPPSATQPRMYLSAGIDALYWIAFEAAPADVRALEAFLQASGFQKVAAGLNGLPQPPKSVMTWWVPPGRDVAVWEFVSPDLRNLVAFVIAEQTGEIWALTAHD